MQEHSLFSTSPLAFIVCRLFDDGHSDSCEVVSHCSFDLHFSSNEHLLMCSLAICMSSLEKRLFSSLAHYLIGSFIIRSHLLIFAFISFALGDRSEKYIAMVYIKGCSACVFL